MPRDLRPHYRLIDKDNAYEVRAYEPMTLAEVTLKTTRRQALSDGFKALFAYISGHNGERRAIPMSVPVTAQADGLGAWAVRFVMPPRTDAGLLPKPDDGRIALFNVPVARAAVKRFSGFAGDRAVARETARLEKWIAKRGLRPNGPAACAFYDSPMTLPFLRRNEIMIGLDY